jgi:hypothetical protein
MKKIAVIVLMGAALVALSTGGALADRLLQGTYTYYNPPEMNGSQWPWHTLDSIVASNPYNGTTALSDGSDVKLRQTNQTYAANPAQISFTDPNTLAFPDNDTAPGDSAVWWGNTPSNNRFNAVLVDLGAPVEIDAIAAVSNLNYSSLMSLQWFRVVGSNDNASWTTLISEEDIQSNALGGPGEK